MLHYYQNSHKKGCYFLKYNKIGLVIAMQEEAAPIIKGLELKKARSRKGGFKVFKNNSVILIISGIGTVNAALAAHTLALVYKCDIILNTGTCGAAGKKFKPCDIVSVKRVYKRDVDLTIAGYKKYEIPGNDEFIALTPDENFVACDCYSSDEFVGINSDVPKDVIVEMEAYSVAFVCRRYDIPCKIYKVVSDLTDTNTDDSEFKANLPKATKALAEYIIKFVKTLI